MSFMIIGPAGHPGEGSVIVTCTFPSSTSTPYTNPRSMMLRLSSGSLTDRSASRTAASVNAVVTIDTSRAPNLSAGTGSRESPHRAMPALGNASIHATCRLAHTRHREAPRPPPLPRQQPAQLGNGVGAGEDVPIGEYQVHRGRQRRQCDAETRDPGLILERHVVDLAVPVPHAQPSHRGLADTAFAVVDQRRSRVTGHRPPPPPHRPTGRAPF